MYLKGVQTKARYILQFRIEYFASEYSVVTSLSHKKVKTGTEYSKRLK